MTATGTVKVVVIDIFLVVLKHEAREDDEEEGMYEATSTALVVKKMCVGVRSIGAVGGHCSDYVSCHYRLCDGYGATPTTIATQATSICFYWR